MSSQSILNTPNSWANLVKKSARKEASFTDPKQEALQKIENVFNNAPTTQSAQKIEHYLQQKISPILRSYSETITSVPLTAAIDPPLDSLTLNPLSPNITKQIKHAHADDVHLLIKVGKNRFHSGSKDGCIRTWHIKGDLIATLNVGLTKTDYRHWVTAIDTIGKRLITGFRDGYIMQYDNKGNLIQTFQPPSPIKNRNCKHRNQRRINVITSVDNDHFLAGLPGAIQVWNKDKGYQKSQKMHENDWVYCIEPLQEDDYAVVIGPNLSLYKKTSQNFEFEEKKKLIYPTSFSSKNRPHISSLISIKKNKNLLATAVFSGKIQLVDVNHETPIIREWDEHQGAAWCVKQIDQNLLLSGADDKLVKVWDIRQKKSVYTLGPHSGRTSAILPLNDHQFVIGSCPKNPKSSFDKATLTFWDLRA